MAETGAFRLLEDLSVAFVMADARSQGSLNEAAAIAERLTGQLMKEGRTVPAAKCAAAAKALRLGADGADGAPDAEKMSALIKDLQSSMDNADQPHAQPPAAQGAPGIDQAAGLLAAALQGISSAAKAAGKQELCAAAAAAADAVSKAAAGGDVPAAEQAVSKTVALLCRKDAAAQTAENAAQEAAAQLTGDVSLVNDFINEAREHLENVNSRLLAIETDPNNQDAINSVFRAFHTMKSLSGFLELTEIHTLVKEVENLLASARKGALQLKDQAIDALFSAADCVKKMVDELKKDPSKKSGLATEEEVGQALDMIQALSLPAAPAGAKKLGEILVEEGKLDAPHLNAALREQEKTHQKLGGVLEHQHAVGAQDIAVALSEQKAAAGGAVRLKETVKIDLEKLDKLIDTIGEIVIAESMVVNDSGLTAGGSLKLTGNISHLNKTTKMLHELGLSLRLIPVAGMFQKMARIARDLSRKHNKKVVFSYRGEDTEIDRTVVEKIGDPLIHMIRNSIDHGIEPADARLKQGKPENALVELNAYHKGGSVYIEVTDDGAGLNREKILARAVENGIIAPDSALTDEELFELIFRPGFSTASIVTDTSGRGVGMDVVKRNVEQLRGRIKIESEQGKGTKFVIILPLTTAIIEAIAVRVNDEKFFIPTLSIVESARPQRELFSTVSGRGLMLSFRGSLIPVFSMKKLFFGTGGGLQEAADRITVIIEDNGRRVGLVVDEILEPQEIVVKSLGSAIDKTDGIAACTIMSDGRVGLILDISAIVRMATNKKEKEEALK